MPVDQVLLTPRPPDPEDWLAAARTVDAAATVQVLPGSAAQILDGADALLLTVVRPRLVDVPGELRRLLGTDDPERPWWTGAVAPTGGGGAARVLAAISSALDGALH